MEILLVEDNPGDVRLTVEALRESKIRNNLTVAGDGVEAMAFLRREARFAVAPRPDLIVLDLNLPRMDGHEVLAEVKSDPDLRSIPVIVLSTARAAREIVERRDLRANCYLTKPIELEQWITVVKSIEDFWLESTLLPAP